MVGEKEISVLENIDLIRSGMVEIFPVEIPRRDIFTPGLYSRQVMMPAGTFVLSERHLTEHPYIVSKGKVIVWTDEDGYVMIVAPYTGVTKPGTQRKLFILEDAIWTTIHANPDNGTDPEEIGKRIIENYVPAVDDNADIGVD